MFLQWSHLRGGCGGVQSGWAVKEVRMTSITAEGCRAVETRELLMRMKMMKSQEGRSEAVEVVGFGLTFEAAHRQIWKYEEV